MVLSSEKGRQTFSMGEKKADAIRVDRGGGRGGSSHFNLTF